MTENEINACILKSSGMCVKGMYLMKVYKSIKDTKMDLIDIQVLILLELLHRCLLTISFSIITE